MNIKFINFCYYVHSIFKFNTKSKELFKEKKEEDKLTKLPSTKKKRPDVHGEY